MLDGEAARGFLYRFARANAAYAYAGPLPVSSIMLLPADQPCLIREADVVSERTCRWPGLGEKLMAEMGRKLSFSGELNERPAPG